MSAPVICLRTVEKIRRIVKILGLESLSHNGFPVVEDYTPENSDPVSRELAGVKWNLFERTSPSRKVDIILLPGELAPVGDNY